MGAVESNWLNKVSEMVKTDNFFKTLRQIGNLVSRLLAYTS